MVKMFAPRCLLACLLASACASANEVAVEVSDNSTNDTPLQPADAGRGTDIDTDGECRSSGGDKSCSAVTICEIDCETNTTCFDACRDGMCTSHEEIYCARVDCIENLCGTYCADLGDADCIVCISLNCAAEWIACVIATSCEAEAQQVK